MPDSTVPLVRLDPREDFAVALARGELGLQRLRIDAGEFEEPLVVRAGVVILAVRTRKRGAGLCRAFAEARRSRRDAAADCAADAE